MPGRMAQAGWLSTTAKSKLGDRVRPGTSIKDGPTIPHGVEGGTRLARLILLTVLTAFLSVQLIDVLTSPTPTRGGKLATALVAVVVMFTLQVLVSFVGASGWPLRMRIAMLVAQGLVTYLPLITLGAEWGGMAGFLAGSALLLTPGVIAWALFAAVTASMLVVPVLMGLTAFSVAYLTTASIDVGLVVFGLTRLSQVVQFLHATRTELAQLAILNERMRFARDLHDLLGYSLSSITLKAELTRRLVTTDPDRACSELAEVLDVARQALADVRLVASGYRNMSLSKEASSVSSLLSAAGISTRIEIASPVPDNTIDTVLATVLREAVTNMLRHSEARRCSIEASRVGEIVKLRVANDGVPRSAACGRAGGGLENLTARLQAVGGGLTARIRPDGWFDVLAEVPVPEAAPVAYEPSVTAGRDRGEI